MLRSFKKALSAIRNVIKMSEGVLSAVKRPNEDRDTDAAVEKAAKIEKKEDKHEPNEERKRKIALLLLYSGVGYHGVQINKDIPTIEKDFVAAVLKAGLIPDDHAKDMSQMCFQRASRTDKGVSAAGQVFSLKMKIHHPDVINRINEHLPAQIRAVAYTRTTKGFSSKNYCDARTYIYMLPTYAFCPCTEQPNEDYRISDDVINEVNTTLQKFNGTHNFHNFTSQVKAEDRSAMRHMKHLEIGRPFIREGLEWAVITVKGQSFMLHHIRKMLGLTVAVIRGFAGQDIFDKVFEKEKIDIPKVPGLGLVLDKLHYDGYNKKYANDGIHEALDWTPYKETIDKFKEEHIFSTIIKTEKEEHTMLMWLENLHYHTYDVLHIEPGMPNPRTPLALTKWKLDNPDKCRDKPNYHDPTLNNSGGITVDTKGGNSSCSTAKGGNTDGNGAIGPDVIDDAGETNKCEGNKDEIKLDKIELNIDATVTTLTEKHESNENGESKDIVDEIERYENKTVMNDNKKEMIS